DPGYALAYARLAIAQQWFNDWEATTDERKVVSAQARGNARKAVELALDPSNAETLYQLADVTASLGRTQEAIAMMRKALTLEPLNASFHFYTGTFLLALGKYAEGQRETERAIELQPGTDGFSSQLAFALVGQGQMERAITAANADPNEGERLQALA